MEKELAIKNIKASLEDLCRASGEVEKRMHKEIILESLKYFETKEEKVSFKELMSSTEELMTKIDLLLGE